MREDCVDPDTKSDTKCCCGVRAALFAFVVALSLTSAGPAVAQDWSSCAGDLDDLRRRASDASSEAEEADDTQTQLKSAQDDLRQCLQSPETFDVYRDGCRSKRSDYESAASAHRSQLDSLQSSLDDVDSKIRSVSSSCGFELRRVSGPPPAIPDGVKNRDACSVYLRFKGRLKPEQMLSACSKQMPESECRKCLGMP